MIAALLEGSMDLAGTRFDAENDPGIGSLKVLVTRRHWGLF
jgi:hypothetical protein